MDSQNGPTRNRRCVSTLSVLGLVERVEFPALEFPSLSHECPFYVTILPTLRSYDRLARQADSRGRSRRAPPLGPGDCEEAIEDSVLLSHIDVHF